MLVGWLWVAVTGGIPCLQWTWGCRHLWDCFPNVSRFHMATCFFKNDDFDLRRAELVQTVGPATIAVASLSAPAVVLTDRAICYAIFVKTLWAKRLSLVMAINMRYCFFCNNHLYGFVDNNLGCNLQILSYKSWNNRHHWLARANVVLFFIKAYNFIDMLSPTNWIGTYNGWFGALMTFFKKCNSFSWNLTLWLANGNKLPIFLLNCTVKNAQMPRKHVFFSWVPHIKRIDLGVPKLVFSGQNRWDVHKHSVKPAQTLFQWGSSIWTYGWARQDDPLVKRGARGRMLESFDVLDICQDLWSMAGKLGW